MERHGMFDSRWWVDVCRHCRRQLCLSCSGNSRQYLGIPGNILSAIIWLRRQVASKNSSAVYLSALAINDLVYLIVYALYTQMMQIIRTVSWLNRGILFLHGTTAFLEPLLILGFSVERLIAISVPLRVRFVLLINVKKPVVCNVYTS